MAGYICKIVIEDTHPPVWRRVMIPEQITFYELHEVIQVLFGWENMHLHEFIIPSDRIRLISKEAELHGTFFEEETLIDSFFKKYKWIRYVYDFGDEWRHRINIEKIDEEYHGRNAVLMKVKGDNFLEDSGGIWGMDESGDNRNSFDKDYVEKELKELTFSVHNESEAVVIPQPIKSPKNIMETIFKVAKERNMNDAQISEFMAVLMKDDTKSLMQKKIDNWYDSFFSILHNRLNMELGTAEECLYETVASIVNGDTIDQIMEKLVLANKDKMTIETCSNMWRILAELMLDLELPMLKGRSRWDYACEKDCSPWFIGMVSENVEKIRNTKERHMYQFPTEIQELMDDTLDIDDSSEKLLDYKKKHHICSEEYLYLLIGKWIFAEKDEKIIKKLIEELKKSSPAGKRAAKLRETLQQEFALDKEFIDKLPDDFDIDDDFGIPDDSMMHDDFGPPNTFGTPDNFDMPETFDPDWLDKAIAKQPYVRPQPKIGRNDPCPCGSGKKYKKCCGRGK